MPSLEWFRKAVQRSLANLFPISPNKNDWALISAQTLLLLCHLDCAKNFIKYQHFILSISDQILAKIITDLAKGIKPKQNEHLGSVSVLY